MESQEKVIEDFLAEAEEDVVGLWSLVWCLKNHLGITDPSDLRSDTTRILRMLLSEKRIRAGLLDEEGKLIEWRMTPEQVVRRIEEEWDQLGREPDIGDIAWFTT